MGTKSRVDIRVNEPGLWTRTVQPPFGGAPTVLKQKVPGLITSSQVTTSQSNPLWLLWSHYARLTPGSYFWKMDRGGPFTTTRRYYADSRGSHRVSVDKLGLLEPSELDPFAELGRDQDLQGGGRNTYKRRVNGAFGTYTEDVFDGCVFAHTDSVQTDSDRNGFYPPVPPISETTLINLGTKALAGCRPDNPIASLFTALGEIKRDGLPSQPLVESWRESTSLAQKAGGEYLNVEFGWKPFISDIRATVRAVHQASSLVEQFVRGAGQPIHRSFVFPIERSLESTDYGQVHPAPTVLNTYVTTPGHKVRDRRTVKQTWFEGAYTYALPGGDEFVDRASLFVKKANYLYGVLPTPAALWELAPWSWLVDWFADVGSILSIVSSMLVDGLVVRYGYLMQRCIVEDTYTLSGSTVLGQPVPALWQTFGSVTKVRRKATPFGFGVDLSALTERQLAILAAIGFTRDGSKIAY